MDFLAGETGSRFLIATLGVAAALAVFAGILWFLRNRPVAPLLTRPAKERRKRLSVVDAAVVDTRRRVVLIRRDDVEHLVLIGGPTDLVIESGVPVAGSPAAVTGDTQPQAIDQPVRTRPHRQAPVEQELEAEPLHAMRAAPVTRQDPFPAAPVAAALPSEENDFTYGPEAALSRSRDFSDMPVRDSEIGTPTAPARQQEPARTPAEQTAPPQNLPELTQDNAEALIDMLRERIIGNDRGTVPPPGLPTRAGNVTERANVESAFERVLDGRPLPGDLPEEQSPQVRPARSWAPPITDKPPPAHAPVPETKNAPPARSDAALELEVARILEELKERRAR